MKILAAFNEKSDAESVASLFVDLGWPRPNVAENSDDAMARVVEEGGCDLLVTDVYLSPAGGFALREALQARLPEMRTIFASARDTSPYTDVLKGAPLLSYPLDAGPLRQSLLSLFPKNTTVRESTAEDLVGRTLGKFDVREKLGERDGVEIYRSRQTNVGRQAMLFVQTPEVSADPARTAAFLEDAKAMARLSHNRVQAIHEAGEADGRHYFSCEFLGDSTLEKLVSSGAKIAPAKALEIICLVADVFSYCGKRLIALAPLTASAVLLPNNALPRLANLACPSTGPSSAAQMKALGEMILEALEISPDSETVRGLASRLIDAESKPLTWEEVEALATDAFPKARHAETPSAAPKTSPENKNWKPLLIGAGASLGIAAVVGLSVFFLPEPSRTQVQDLGALVEIPAGEFDFQGESASLTTFYISKYEVSIAEYQKFLEDLEQHPEKASALAHPDQPPGKSHLPKGWADRTEIQPPTPGYFKRAGRDGQYLGAALTLDSPVFGVDWFDAYAYSKWCGRRLPTEQEWEKASRGKAQALHPWGDGNSEEKANLGFDFTPSPDAKVGGGKDGFKRWSRVDLPATDRSDYGVHGMAGNVSEWTASREDAENGSSNPVLRGGNWMTGTDDSSDNATAMKRATDWKAYQSSDTIGFRTASDKPE